MCTPRIPMRQQQKRLRGVVEPKSSQILNRMTNAEVQTQKTTPRRRLHRQMEILEIAGQKTTPRRRLYSQIATLEIAGQ